jgi:phosphatase NudJ
VAREPIPTWFFALVVVRRDDGFLVVHETEHGQLWWLPGGRAEPGETLAQAACREALEETGVPVVLEGVLRLEHTPLPAAARVRAVFVARPADDTPPKSTPDEHSLEARWVSLDELAALPLRGEEVRAMFEAVARGAAIHPLEVLAREGDPL